MNTYFSDLFKQIEALDLNDTSCIELTANESEPAILHVRDGTILHIYIQNEDLTKLELAITKNI